MKRIVFITLSAVLVIGITLLWLGNRQNAPAVSAQPRDLTTLNAADISAYRWGAMTKHYASHQDASTSLNASNRYPMELQYAPSGWETSNPASVPSAGAMEMFYAQPMLEAGETLDCHSSLDLFYACQNSK